MLASAVYGLPEFHRAALRGATLVATPGCYVTAAIMALRPLVAAGLVERDGLIVERDYQGPSRHVAKTIELTDAGRMRIAYQ